MRGSLWGMQVSCLALCVRSPSDDVVFVIVLLCCDVHEHDQETQITVWMLLCMPPLFAQPNIIGSCALQRWLGSYRATCSDGPDYSRSVLSDS